MIDSSEKRNRRLGSELQNSHVCEKCDPNLPSTVYMKTHYFFHKMKSMLRCRMLRSPARTLNSVNR